MWQSLEQVRGLCAATVTWRRYLGGAFDSFALTFLRRWDDLAESIWCEECYCAHTVVTHPDESRVGVCECDPWNCDDMQLSREDITVWEVNWTKLGRGIARAFGFDPREADVGIPMTKQIGAFSAASMPVFLTIQPDAISLRQAVAQLVARQRRHFVVLTPTNRFADAQSRELLANANAGLFAMEPLISLGRDGSLRASKSAGELFSPFLPEMPEAATDDEARRLFAMAKAMSPEGKVLLAPPIEVLRLYCVENLSRNEIAKRCGCAPSLVSLRFRELERQFQRPMKSLRTLSDSFARVADSLTDSRARRIHRKSAMDAPEDRPEW